jgi:hypothetical protein
LKRDEYQQKKIQRKTNFNSDLRGGSEKSHGKKHDEGSEREEEPYNP